MLHAEIVKPLLHLIPASARELMDVVGLEAMLKLVNALGGTTFPVSKNKTREGQIRFEMLAEVIGVEAAEQLTRYCGGSILIIPRFDKVMREVRNRAIRNEFDAMLQAGDSATWSVTKLALKHAVTSRTVWEVVNTPNQDLGVYGESQRGLFDENVTSR
jgi:hypothetical protein